MTDDLALDSDTATDGGDSPPGGTLQSAAAAAPKKSLWRTLWAAPLTAKVAILWLVLILGGAIYARIDRILDGSMPLQDPFLQTNLFGDGKPIESPSGQHWLGTDVLARDTFSRILHGGWVSLIVAATAVTFGIVVGGSLGSFVGYVKGRSDSIIMSGIDVILAFPALVLLLAMVSIWEVRSLTVISLVVGILSIPIYTRIARANALAISNREFVQAAEAIGTKRRTILFKEIMPNVMPPLLAYAMVQSAYVIVLEGTLSFLGLSVALPEPTWGNMINEARRDINITILPVLWPSLVLTMTVLSLNQVGDWLMGKNAVRASAL